MCDIHIRNGRAKSAMTLVIMLMLLLSLATCQDDHLPVVGAAWPCADLRFTRIPGKISIMSVMAAWAVLNIMFGMDIIACGTSDDCRYITFAAVTACMYIKTYDTQRVPYHQQHRCN